MRHNVLVRKRLRHLQDKHNFTEAQLKAITPYLVKMEHRQLLDVPLRPITDSQYECWYSPTKE